jgi:hypothetical protein
MAFTFQKYGTFAGPGVDINYRNNDDFSLDPFDGYWNIDDVSMVLANVVESPSDYVYMHLNGFDTSVVTLERSQGNIPNFNVNANQTTFSGNVDIGGDLTVEGNLLVETISGTAWSNLVSDVNSKKSFDISHPSKGGYRLRYICLEGPEAEVYFRGKLSNGNVIELPDYWKDLVDIETVGVTLTPIGCYQELFVEKIEWGSKIIVKNNAGGAVNCSYVVYGERKDVDKNISEYQGTSPADYPGDNSQYVINGVRA